MKILPHELTIEYYRLYDQGMTMQQIADLNKIDKRIISRSFKQQNLHIRTKSENTLGERNGHFKGDRTHTRDGYIEIWDGTQRVLEHRFVMEQAIGRKLLPTEIIHHIDGIRDHNELGNLKLTDASGHMQEHKLKENEWSRHYEHCVRCGTTEREHAARGLCTRCFVFVGIVRKRGYETQYDETGKRIFTVIHRERLKQNAIRREANKKARQAAEQKAAEMKQKEAELEQK